jgi:integrative and conjugative element protein (TIGR02256 family)
VITVLLTADGANLVLSDPVVEHFALYQQVRHNQTEAGGQLFARLTRYEIFVEEATGPRPTDRRGRTHYTPDRQAERKEIRERFDLGLHYVGDWHTHPENVPVPSPIDRFTISDCSRRSTHKLAGFLLIVVGNGSFPECLHISLHEGASSTGFIGSLRHWWTEYAVDLALPNVSGSNLPRPVDIQQRQLSKGRRRDTSK